MSIKLVIFDLDGVLVDACELHYEALNDALYEVASFKLSREEHETIFNGLPTQIKLDLLYRQGRIQKIFFNKIFTLKQDKTKFLINKFITIDHQKISLLERLRSQGIIIGCYTNAIRESAELMLEKSGLLKWIDLLVSNQNVKNPKPDPEGYIKIMKHFNIKPYETLIVEDSDKGYRAAIASKANAIKVKDPKDVTMKRIEQSL